MSSVTESIEHSFKSLVSEKTYRSITVKEICERAFISRRTFYANFIDKRAVIAYLFRRDAIAPVDRALELLSLNETCELAPVLVARYYQGVLDERDYYQQLVKPMAGTDATFELVVARALSKTLEKLIRKHNDHADEDELDFATYYHAAAGALTLERWICAGYEQAPEQLGEMQGALLAASLEPLFSKGRLL